MEAFERGGILFPIGLRRVDANLWLLGFSLQEISIEIELNMARCHIPGSNLGSLCA